jgi:hypothetical protein
MLSTPRHLGRPLIALVAIVAASLTASEAAACSSMKSGGGSCATVRSCCKSEASHAPATQTELVIPAATPGALRTCETSPGEDCVCSSEEPAAPAQESSRTEAEGRSELGQGSAFVHLGDDAARIKAGLKVVPTHGPPKIPLYLRNARLLF